MDKIVPTDRRYKEIVNCSNRRRGCRWSGLLGKLREHCQECEFEDVNCTYCNTIFERRKLDEHQNMNPTQEKLLEGCPNAVIHCLFCKERHQRQNLKSHMNRNPSWEERYEGCRCIPVECKFCKVTVARQELKGHLNMESGGENQLQGCDKVQIACSFCGSMYERKKLKDHLNLRPTMENWKQGCDKAVVYCMFCKNQIARSQLGEHINIDPTPDTWLKGCDDADVKCIYCKEEFKRRQLKIKAKKMDDPLNDQHIRAVVATALIAKEKWYEIGFELKIDKKALDEFKATHKGSKEECFYEVIQTWLSSKQQKSWKILVKALNSSKVGLKDQAEAVKRSRYCMHNTVFLVY